MLNCYSKSISAEDRKAQYLTSSYVGRKLVSPADEETSTRPSDIKGKKRTKVETGNTNLRVRIAIRSKMSYYRQICKQWDIEFSPKSQKRTSYLSRWATWRRNSGGRWQTRLRSLKDLRLYTGRCWKIEEWVWVRMIIQWKSEENWRGWISCCRNVRPSTKKKGRRTEPSKLKTNFLLRSYKAWKMNEVNSNASQERSSVR